MLFISFGPSLLECFVDLFETTILREIGWNVEKQPELEIRTECMSRAYLFPSLNVCCSIRSSETPVGPGRLRSRLALILSWKWIVEKKNCWSGSNAAASSGSCTVFELENTMRSRTNSSIAFQRLRVFYHVGLSGWCCVFWLQEWHFECCSL